MPASSYDFTYNSPDDCFVIMDGKGAEVCRTASPHKSSDKLLATLIAAGLNEGRLIFPTSPATPNPP